MPISSSTVAGKLCQLFPSLVLPPDHIQLYEANLSDWTSRIAGIIKPQEIPEVAQIIEAANQYRGIQLHPISVGANWGFGSKLPPKDGVWVMDLSLLNRIRDYNAQEGLVCLDPGVTQGQLDDLLRMKDKHFFNITGSGRATSIMGNVLQRGVGYFGLRAEDITSLTGVRGDGKCFSLPSHNYSRTTHTYPYGIGPDWRGLLFQSDLAVVTSMTLRLSRRPEKMDGLFFAVSAEEQLAAVMDELARFLQEGWITSIPHVGDRVRLSESVGMKGHVPCWAGVIPLYGPKAVVKAAANEIKRSLSPVASCALVSETPGLGPLTEYMTAHPTDAALAGVSYPQEVPPAGVDYSPRGLRYINALVPLIGSEVTSVVRQVRERAWNITARAPGITVNAINPRCVVLIISLPHVRNTASIAAANREYDALTSWLWTHGYLPYRPTHGQIDKLAHSSSSTEGMYSELKELWDPANVLV